MTPEERFNKFWNSLIVPQSLAMQEKFEYAKPIAKKAYLAATEDAARIADKYRLEHTNERGEVVLIVFGDTIAAAIRGE